jgi:hypothetical protein
MNRLQQHLRRIYTLLGETNKFGFVITPGPHEWNVEGQVAVLRWFNRHLKGEDPPIENAAKAFFTAQQLKVFNELPVDAVNTNIQASFVPAGKPLAAGEAKSKRESLVATLKQKSFNGWPAEDLPLDAKPAFSVERDGVKLSAWDFTSRHEVPLRIYFLEYVSANGGQPVLLHILDQSAWTTWLAAFRAFGPGLHADLSDAMAGELRGANPPADAAAFEKLRRELSDKNITLAFFAPRGIGLNAWSGGEKRLTQIRRRFMLLGQTLAGMQVWDIRRAVQMIHFVREGDKAKVELRAAGAMSSQTQFAALFEPSVRKLEVETWRGPETGGGDYLNFDKFLDAQAVAELNAAIIGK